MKRVEALFFDFDGTLLDGSGHRVAIVSTCMEIASMHPELDGEELIEANGEMWSRYWPTVEERWTLGSLDGETLTTEAWRQTLSACGCDDPAIARTARVVHARNLEKSLRVYPDALTLLPALHGRYSLALVTNGASDTQRTSLRILRIDKHFDALAISGEIGVAKPDVAIFRSALRELGIEAEQVWHVGDDPQTDIAGAHAAGLTAVWLNRSGRLWNDDIPKPHYEIGSLSALPKLLSA